MSENKEDSNEFEDQPEVKTPAEETAPTPEPSAVHEAVKEALVRPPQVVRLAPCPCGESAVNLLIDLPQGTKIGRATCGTCGIWGTDFLAPRSQDKELLGRAATKSWNEAPRILATDPA